MMTTEPKESRCKHDVHGRDCFECFPTEPKYSGAPNGCEPADKPREAAVSYAMARNPGCKWPKGSGSALVHCSITDYLAGHAHAAERIAQLERELEEQWEKCPNEEWECTKIQRRLEKERDTLRAELEIAREALTRAEKRFSHIENWHRDYVTPDTFKDCQDIGLSPEVYLRDGKLECRATLSQLSQLSGSKGDA